MKRQIEFRGKTEQGEWHEGYYVKSSDYFNLREIHIIVPQKTKTDTATYTIQAQEVIPETVGQYTGLTDKNGKKIFEGDIVKIYWKDNVLTIGDIKYDEKLCRFVICEDFAYPYGFDNTTPFEVIGNIHDNPELLEV